MLSREISAQMLFFFYSDNRSFFLWFLKPKICEYLQELKKKKSLPFIERFVVVLFV